MIVEDDGLIVEATDAEQRDRVADEKREEDGKVERNFVHGRAIRKSFSFSQLTKFDPIGPTLHKLRSLPEASPSQCCNFSADRLR